MVKFASSCIPIATRHTGRGGYGVQLAPASHAIRAPPRRFCGMFAMNLLTIIRRRLQKAAFECSVEAGGVLVSNGVRDFLNALVAVCEKAGGSLESLLAQ